MFACVETWKVSAVVGVQIARYVVVVPTRVPLIGVRAPPLAVAMNCSDGIWVGSALVAVPSRKTGAPTVVTVASSDGRVIVVVGATTALTVTRIDGDETTVLPVSSIATT